MFMSVAPQICDLGSAFRVDELEDVGDMPYLQSRFYRAPEVILGYKPRVCHHIVG
jgi:hypothetical protein